MNNHFKVAIIGAGASGLLSAIELLSGENHFSNNDIVIFERLDRVGKKLTATGNGQGNLTNFNISENNYFGDKAFVNDFINNLKNVDIQKYLNVIGIFLTCDKDNKMYPLSKKANSVLDIFRLFLENKATVKTNSYVDKIVKNGEIFEIIANGEKFYANFVILSVGGKASKQFGTDGSSYKLAESFGHQTTKLYPTLVQIKTNTENIKVLRGIREEVKLSVLENDKEIFSTNGDVIFTEYGISGNSVFKASSYIAGKENITLKIEFLPNLTQLEIENIIKTRQETAPYINNENILLGLVNNKVGEVIYKTSRDKSPKSLVNTMKNFTLNFKGTLGFDNAQVTRGGIATKDIDSKTYASMLCKNLYITGEMLDIDGECGGYNLTFAFITGIISAKDIKNKTINMEKNYEI